MPVSLQEQRRLDKEKAGLAEVKKEYEFTDPNFTPDSQGGIGGVKTYLKGGKHCALLTEAQAKYWLDQGVAQLVETQQPQQG